MVSLSSASSASSASKSLAASAASRKSTAPGRPTKRVYWTQSSFVFLPRLFASPSALATRATSSFSALVSPPRATRILGKNLATFWCLLTLAIPPASEVFFKNLVPARHACSLLRVLALAAQDRVITTCAEKNRA